MPTLKNCLTCEWFREYPEPQDPFRYGVGFCQRYPPDHQSCEMATPDHRYPTVMDVDHCCGEYKIKN